MQMMMVQTYGPKSTLGMDIKVTKIYKPVKGAKTPLMGFSMLLRVLLCMSNKLHFINYYKYGERK